MNITKRSDLLIVDNWVDENLLSQESGTNLHRWLVQSEYSDFSKEIHGLIEQEDLEELEDAFRLHIEFGTGGIRGKMGVGPNRINLRTIGEAAQGLAQYLKKTWKANIPECCAVIAYDTRINSKLFAQETASVLSGNGIVVYLFDKFRSTPELSFAVRELCALAGVVISASHNPPSDNGFKAYWKDGGQVVPPHDRNIMLETQTISKINRANLDTARTQDLIRNVHSKIDLRYHEKLTTLSLSENRDIRIVYTPLHGVGTTSVVPVLKHLGYKDLHFVDEQTIPDGKFSTVPGGIANPEDSRTLIQAIRKAENINADIVLATDPDADRLACALPHPEKGWNAPPESLALNGNQIGALLCHYILSQKKAKEDLPENGVICKTIVTTDLTALIGRAFGLKVVDNLLVGFKYIADVIEKLPKDKTFLFGTEESHGYLFGSFIRDKDAASAAIPLVECTALLKTHGRTIQSYLDEIYQEFGYFQEIQKSIIWKGALGHSEMVKTMLELRQNPPLEIGGHPIVEIHDRQTGKAYNLKTGTLKSIEGARGNVIILTFTAQGHTRVTIRPSGTEPKIKYYVSASSTDNPHLDFRNPIQTKAAINHLAEEILYGIVKKESDRAYP